MNQDRVYVEVHTDSTVWTLITSRQQANDLVASWQAPAPSKAVSIEGTIDHRDGNGVVFHIETESIIGVHIQEMKL